MSLVHVISVSGGKDSTACILLARETVDRLSIAYVFCDTGNEHPLTYEYLTYLERKLGITILRLKADFAEKIMERRMFVARDARIGRRNGRRIRFTNAAKRRILGTLKPSGNPYLDLCMLKGRFPSRKAQFCTEELKTNLLTEYQMGLCDQGFTVWAWQGVRADESATRRFLPEFEEVGGGLFNYRPIIRWKASDCFDAHAACDVDPNPLYRMGMSRVGCMPCINASKPEIREISIRFPDQIDRIEEWEGRVKDASKRNASSFFPDPDRDAHLDKRGIRKVIQWSKTTRGGRQFDLLGSADDSQCSSSYGLCE